MDPDDACICCWEYGANSTELDDIYEGSNSFAAGKELRMSFSQPHLQTSGPNKLWNKCCISVLRKMILSVAGNPSSTYAGGGGKEGKKGKYGYI